MLGVQWGKRSLIRFAEEGAKLVITDISENRLNETREKLLQYLDAKHIVAIRGSVLNFDEVKEVVDEANQQIPENRYSRECCRGYP